MAVTSQRQSSILVQELLRSTPLSHPFEGSFDIGDVKVDLSRPHRLVTGDYQVLWLIANKLLGLIPVVGARILLEIRSL